MSAMERSLRRALDNGDASDPAFREAIYSASERALERMLADKGMAEAEAHAQRVRLAQTINSVEDDYYQSIGTGGGHDELEAVTPADAGASWDDLDAGQMRPVEDRTDPAEPFDHPAPDEAAFENAATDAAWSPGSGKAVGTRAAARRPSRSAIAIVIVGLLVLAGIWFIYRAVFQTFQETGSLAGTAVHLVDAGPRAGSGEWITLFDGTRLDAISNPGGGQVQAFGGDGREPAVRLTSSGEGTEMSVAVGPGLFGRLKGRKVRVEITAGTPDGSARKFSVRCMFGRQTACAHLTFITDRPSEPFVFDMTVLGTAGRSGSITISPGFGVAKDLDLYRVRLHPIDTI